MFVFGLAPNDRSWQLAHKKAPGVKTRLGYPIPRRPPRRAGGFWVHGLVAQAPAVVGLGRLFRLCGRRSAGNLADLFCQMPRSSSTQCPVHFQSEARRAATILAPSEPHAFSLCGARVGWRSENDMSPGGVKELTLHDKEQSIWAVSFHSPFEQH
jgi:hypothetical protein